MDAPSEDPALQSLIDMFGPTINRDVIETVLQSYGGDVSQTIDAMLKFSISDNNEQASNVQLANEPSTVVSATQENQEAQMQRTKRESRAPARDNRIEKLNTQLQNIVDYHKCGYRTLVLMRGCPGSGKSTLARQIVDITVGKSPINYKCHIFSTDDFFSLNGTYVYDVTRLTQAHYWNKQSVRNQLALGLSPVIVDNTHCQGWEMKAHLYAAVQNGYFVELIEPNTPWAKNASQLAKKNTHNVPHGKILKMLESYEMYHSSENILKTFQFTYPPLCVPPVMRSYPPLPTAALQKTAQTTVTPGDAEVSSNQYIQNGQAASSTQPKNYETNRQEDKENQLFRNSLEEFEKLSNEWENGVKWFESENRQDTGRWTLQHYTNAYPKPQRPPKSREHSRTRSVSQNRLTVGESDNLQDQYDMSEWQQISSSIPAWNHDAIHNFEEPPQTTSVEKITWGTSVESDDHYVNNSKFCVINARPRDINFSYIAPSVTKIPHKVMLDKSSTTAEEFDPDLYICKNADKHFLALRKMFKQVSEEDLREIFEKCGGNVNWASELLLDGIPDAVLAAKDGDSSDDEDNGSDEMCDCVAAYNIVPRAVEKPNSIEATPLSMPNIKKKKEKPISESSINLKIQIEQNIDIADHHYSNHSLKIKKSRHGVAPYEVGMVETCFDDPMASVRPSTSKAVGQHSDMRVFENKPIDLEDSGGAQDSMITECSSPSDEGYCPVYSEETVNVTLGMELINQAISTFENRDIVYPDNIAPVVNMPKSLLNQIYALWIESLAHQIDTQTMYTEILSHEDEEFARQLAAKERELEVAGLEPEVPDLSEIMDMELALTLARRDLDQWKNSEPTDLAARLTRDKLHNLFPDIDKSILSELLVAHDNSFQQTVEGLLISTGQAKILEEKNGINKFVMKREMERQQEVLEQARQQALRGKEWPVSGEEEPVRMETVTEYRERARSHLKHRNYNHEKAQHYFNNGKTDAATYHAQLGYYHKQQCEHFNSRAAITLIQVHSADKSNNTLDLHYLFVAEAVQTLDLFLDHHIQQLLSLSSSGPQNNSLFIITGRGLHSRNGAPRIKPAVKRRLAQRGLTYSQLNPGLLAVGIDTTNHLTHQL